MLTANTSFALILSDREVWNIAGEYIDRFSDFAAIEAAKQADWFLQNGDLAGQRNWQRIVKAITFMTDADGEIPN